MPKYKVEFPVIHKKKKYMPGKPVTMSEDLAKPLLENNVLSPWIEPDTESQNSGEITEEAIVAAIATLDTMNATLWTGDGKPRTEALEPILKGKVSAAERDAGWDRYQKETA